MRKNILAIILVVLFAGTIAITAFAAEVHAPSIESTSEPVATISEAYIPSEAPETEPVEEVIVLENVVVERVEPTTLDEANSSLEAAISRENTTMAVYEGLLELGYPEEHPAVVMAKIDLENAKADVAYYTEQQAYQTEQEAARQEARKWEKRAAEYPVATKVWLYMKNEFGWSDTVCAGIMGNMMAECGGCWTSDLDWDVSGSNGYGMIQWIGGRRKQLFSIYGNKPGVESQLKFIRDELYGTNGVTKQVTDSQLNKIMNADSPEDCAYAFASYYERCAESHRSVRRNYARRAYEYFVG